MNIRTLGILLVSTISLMNLAHAGTVTIDSEDGYGAVGFWKTGSGTPGFHGPQSVDIDFVEGITGPVHLENGSYEEVATRVNYAVCFGSKNNTNPLIVGDTTHVTIKIGQNPPGQRSCSLTHVN